MKNFIPIDYFTNENRNTVYTSKVICESEEGVEAVGFDSSLDLPICTIEDGAVVEDTTKKNAKDKLKYKEDRSKEYEKRGLHFQKFVEMLIEEDTAGIAAFRAERQTVKNAIPKPV